MIRYIILDGIAVRGAPRLRKLFEPFDAACDGRDDCLDPLLVKIPDLAPFVNL